MPDPEHVRARRYRTVQDSLIKRGRPGFLLPGALASLYCVAVHDSRVDLIVTMVMMVLLLVIGGLRLWFSGVERFRPDFVRWRQVVTVLSITNIALIDLLAGFIAWHRGADAASLLFVTTSIGYRASGAYTLSPDRRLVRIFNRWTRLPLFVALAIVGSNVSLALLALLFLHSLWFDAHGKQLNDEYWSSVCSREELEIAHEKLTQEVAMRERAEDELRLAQKLESVGRLAAGIAHEINTPLQAIVGCLDFAEQGTRELLELARRLEPTAMTANERDELEYLTANLPDSMTLAKTCLDRTASIVRSVKQFAHPGQDEMTATDLNSAIRTALDISRHEYAEHTDVHLHLGDIPLVDCHAGEINQVLLNIIVNAAQAIESSSARGTKRGAITVTTDLEHDFVRIVIADNADGIPLAHRGRIFDPFFTTKEVGRGTGQGLAVVHTIVTKRHGGHISFTTEPGEGTEFVIRLPLGTAAQLAA